MRLGNRVSSPLVSWIGVRTASSAVAALRRFLKLASARPLPLDEDASPRFSCPPKALAAGTPAEPTAKEAAAAPATRPRNARRLELFDFLFADASSGPMTRLEGFMNNLLFRMCSNELGETRAAANARFAFACAQLRINGSKRMLL